MEVWWAPLVPVIFLVIGLIFVFVGVRGWRQQGSFERRATGRASAVFTDIRYSTMGSGADRSTTAYPIVRFTLPDGRTVEAEAMAVDHPGSTWRRKGIEVSVVYDPANPTSVAIEGRQGPLRLLRRVRGHVRLDRSRGHLARRHRGLCVLRRGTVSGA